MKIKRSGYYHVTKGGQFARHTSSEDMKNILTGNPTLTSNIKEALRPSNSYEEALCSCLSDPGYKIKFEIELKEYEDEVRLIPDLCTTKYVHRIKDKPGFIMVTRCGGVDTTTNLFEAQNFPDRETAQWHIDNKRHSYNVEVCRVDAITSFGE